MTRETFDFAKDLVHDIEVLETIQDTQCQSHWVAFVTADNEKEQLYQYSTELMDDFKEFVTNEIEKLKRKLASL